MKLGLGNNGLQFVAFDSFLKKTVKKNETFCTERSFYKYTLHLTPYTLHLTPYTLHLTPYTLHLTPYTLHLTPYTLHLTPYTMPPFKVSDQELLNALLEVFRKEGFEGASMTLISEATGLKRSSMYHRFPGGKEQMAKEVLEYTGAWVSQYIGEILAGEGAPVSRLATVLDHISLLYAGGKKPCILRALLMGGGHVSFQKQVQSRIQSWLDAFERFGEEIGMPKSEAYQAAQQSLIQIQGSLIISQALDSQQPFEDSLQSIREFYKPYIK